MAENILEHKGLLSFSQIDALLTQFKFVSDEYELKFKLYKKIITVMIEALENVYKYSNEYESFVLQKEEYVPSFELMLNNETLMLITTNPVRKKHIPILTDKIQEVNSLERDELKRLYIDTITDGKFSIKGGAGLGFIEMVRTTGNKLNYSFTEIDEEYSNYTFIATFTI